MGREHDKDQGNQGQGGMPKQGQTPGQQQGQQQQRPGGQGQQQQGQQQQGQQARQGQGTNVQKDIAGRDVDRNKMGGQGGAQNRPGDPNRPQGDQNR
jgi:translation initiation factor IF-2